MNPPLHRLTFIGLLGLTALVSRLPAAVPQSLAEAEGFARELIEKHLHHRQGVLTTDNLKKMKIQRNDAGTATTFFLPRGTRSSPDFVIEVVMSPTNAPLSPGHMIAHASVQRHRYADYADASPLATQSEQYDRTIACLGPEAACVSLSAEKRRADDFGVVLSEMGIDLAKELKQRPVSKPKRRRNPRR